MLYTSVFYELSLSMGILFPVHIQALYEQAVAAVKYVNLCKFE